MVFYNPFREEAAAARSERQQLDQLLLISAPHERIMLAVTGVVLVAFVLWVLLGSVVRNVTLDGIVISEGTRQEIAVLEPGYLVEFQVEPGDRIAAGDVIAQQTVPELEREISLLRNHVNSLTTEIGASSQQDEIVHSLLNSAEAALLQLEAQRSARSLLVSHSEGEVTALKADPGDYLPAGTVVAQVRSGENLARQAVLQVASKLAQRLKTGMPVDVEILMPDGAKRFVQGKIDSLTAGPIPRWLATLLHVPAEYGNLINVWLPQTSFLAVPDGTPCHIRIEIDRTTPLGLLISGRS